MEVLEEMGKELTLRIVVALLNDALCTEKTFPDGEGRCAFLVLFPFILYPLPRALLNFCEQYSACARNSPRAQ